MAFSADWLRLREPADHAARAAALTELVASLVNRASPARPLVDLATGTGSNVRYWLPRLRGAQYWRLLDADARLLDALESEMRSWIGAHRASVRREGSTIDIVSGGERHRLIAEQRDLAPPPAPPAAALAVDDSGLVGSARLVTASALLDLVSDSWLERLADQCRNASAVALFALSYDGRIACVPSDEGDEIVRTLVNRHQHGDKGFGAALGPEATSHAESCFRARGYETRRAQSDWSLGAADAALQRELVDGWAEAARELAATEMAATEPGAIERWRVRRQAHIAEGVSRIVVGHEDLAAWLPG